MCEWEYPKGFYFTTRNPTPEKSKVRRKVGRWVERKVGGWAGK